jgi:hypothetical protein
MEHFSDQTWADFVRGVGTPESTQQVEQHLTDLCLQCKSSLSFWQDVQNLGVRDTHYAAPENLVRMAKVYFEVSQPAPQKTWPIAALVFDSVTQPLPAGVRGGAINARQVIYEAEGLTVDLRFERKQLSNLVCVAGQVLDREAPLSWLSNAAIVLLSEKGQMVTKTEANDYGEFQLEFEPQSQLRMSVITQGRKTLRIALGSFE